MSKLHLAPILALTVAAWPSLGSAQTAPSSSPTAGTAGATGAAGNASCPPGSWFCAPPPQQQAAPAGQPVESLEPLPDPERPPPPRRNRRGPAPAPEPPPPPVAYDPPPVGEIERSETPTPYEYAPPPERWISPPHEWGMNLHGEGAAIGHGAAGDSSMGGFGAGLRFKPTRHFGVEGDVDFIGGRDYNGDNRNETAFTFNGLVFLNPRSRAQVYLLGGFGWSGAHVTSDVQRLDVGYTYFGAQAGLGLEFRFSRVLALNVDFRGFIRSRTDNGAQAQPEFVDAYGRSTNTSGGGLLTGGMTLYF